MTLATQQLQVTGKGSHAEYAVAPATQLAKLPANVTFEAGATLGLVGLTGRLAVDAAAAKPGNRVLVTGALAGSAGWGSKVVAPPPPLAGLHIPTGSLMRATQPIAE